MRVLSPNKSLSYGVTEKESDLASRLLHLIVVYINYMKPVNLEKGSLKFHFALRMHKIILNFKSCLYNL